MLVLLMEDQNVGRAHAGMIGNADNDVAAITAAKIEGAVFARGNARH